MNTSTCNMDTLPDMENKWDIFWYIVWICTVVAIGLAFGYGLACPSCWH